MSEPPPPEGGTPYLPSHLTLASNRGVNQRRVKDNSSFHQAIEASLAEIRARGLERRLRIVTSTAGPEIEIQGQPRINFASNDYLGLAQHPALKEAAAKSSRDFGAGAGGSRLLCGTMRPHIELEEALADLKGTEAALTFASGYMAAAGLIPAFLGSHDLIIVDRLVHASLVDAARLSGAALRVFKHNNLDDLEAILKWAAGRHQKKPRRVLIVTETIFSMEGDAAPLAELVRLKEAYGAWLMVDEAHATGLYGATGSGRVSEEGLTERIELQMGTLGKALGAEGGYVCGSRELVDYLLNLARTFIFTTAPVPAAVGAARAGVQIVTSAEGAARRLRLWERVRQYEPRKPVPGSTAGHVPPRRAEGKSPVCPSPIVPLIVGAEKEAVRCADQLASAGFFVPAIRYPSVGRGLARLRISLTASHTESHVRRLLEGIAALPLEEIHG